MLPAMEAWIIKKNFMYLSLFVCTGSSLLLAGFLWLWASAGCSLVAVLGLLIAMASFVVEHRFQVWVSVVAPRGL